MLRYLTSQTASLLVTILMVIAMVFFGMRLLPGDPAVIRAGLDATPQQIENTRRVMGLDRPLPEQFVNYVGGLFKGDFGRSWRQNRPVLEIIGNRLPVTLLLAGFAYALSLLLGFGFGILSGALPGSIWDRAVRVYTTLGLAFPEFWIAFILILLFSVNLGWLPLLGYPENGPFPDQVRHLILPAFTLALPRSAQLARLTRALLSGERSQDYVRTARSKGLSGSGVTRHITVNTLPGTFPLAALELGGLLTGVIIAEQVFSLPGLGQLL
ncbi:MAG TPA: ABC transporter permease, partial [Deinococcales bacterium]|nr:ABC transporter permease [Deinococcales bacterium]